MTATTEGEAFKRTVAPILEAVGPYPHAELSKTARTKQGTRLIKLQCPTCLYTVRITRKWLDEVGAPDCPSHGDQMEELKTTRTAENNNDTANPVSVVIPPKP